MNITANDAKASRTKLGLSQAAVAKATGIPRNIMSAFEQRKIVMLDEMQIALVDFFESKGLTLEGSGAANEASFGAPEGRFSEERSLEEDSDVRIRDGFCIPVGLDLDDVDELLEQVHDTETEIECSLSYEVVDDGFFSKSIASDSQARHERLVHLYTRWACLVQRLHGRPLAISPCDLSEIDKWPKDQYQLMRQMLAKEFGVADKAA